MVVAAILGRGTLQLPSTLCTSMYPPSPPPPPPTPHTQINPHLPSVTQGGTQFVGLAEVVRSMSSEQRARYERLSQMVPYRKQRRGWFVHPLIYSHPATGEVTMNLNLGESTLPAG